MATSPEFSRAKQAVFRVALALGVLLVLDTIAFGFLSYLRHHYSVFSGVSPPDDEILARFGRTSFHPVLGWDVRADLRGSLGERRAREYAAGSVYTIKTFGDSFTYSAVGGASSFQTQVEERTGWACLNYGVPGYGTDQAVLKYVANRVATKYTILGIVDENIGRCVNVLRGFYTLADGDFQTKPRFVLGENGRVRLLENPVRDIEGLARLQDAEFVDGLREHDYWSRYFAQLGAPVELTWPAGRVLIAHFGFFVRNFARLGVHAVRPTYESTLWRYRFYHLYEPDSEGMAVMRHILDLFARTAAARSEIPIVLIFPSVQTVEIVETFGRKPYEPLRTHLQQQHLHVIDTTDTLVAGGDGRAYYRADGHFNAEGNAVVADLIIDSIRKLEDAAPHERLVSRSFRPRWSSG